MNNSEIKIGVDNTENEGFAILLDEEARWVSCDEYDWLYDLTDEQVEILKSGDIEKQRSVLEAVTGGSAEWFDHE